MTRTEICNYFLARCIKVNDIGCLRVLPEVLKANSNDYLQVFYKNKNIKLCRLIALEKYGDNAMKGLETHHDCHNPFCINPDHLSYGTHKKNMQDKVKAGRAYTGEHKGEKGGLAKLTDLEVKEIKKLLRQKKLTNREIAQKFGVSDSCIAHIKSGRCWNHIK